MYSVLENEYSVKFALSRKEMKEARGAIKVHAIEEKVKGYFLVKVLGILLMVCLGVCGLAMLIVLGEAWSLFDTKITIYTVLASGCLAAILSDTQDKLLKYYLKKNEAAEQGDEPKMVTVSLMERGLLVLKEGYEFVALWPSIIQLHEQDGFIYLRHANNHFDVIPVRAFQDEVSKHAFMTKLESYVYP